MSRFADVKKKTKEKKVRDPQAAPAEFQTTSTRGRGGRGGFEGGRGGRGRGTERGRGGSRGGRGGASAATSGRVPSSTITTTETSSWDTAPEKTSVPSEWDQPSATADGSTEEQSATASAVETLTAAASNLVPSGVSSLIPAGVKQSWASMFAPKPPAPVAKSTPAAVPEPEPETQEEAPLEQEVQSHAQGESDALPSSQNAEELPIEEKPIAIEESASLAPYETEAESATQLTPSKDKLTEDNVEHIPDASIPAPTETAASTVDPGSTVGTVTPFGNSHQLSAGRPPMGGYAASAWKATGAPGRTASFQRIMEQREAVVMPSNHAVDRAAVQFGSMGLNGESNPLDIDEDREDAETRTQPPQQSPPSQPRASLPPAPQQQLSASEQHAQDNLPTPKPAPGLPPLSQLPSTSITNQNTSQNPLDSQSQQYGQYGRYGAGAGNQEQSASSQKPYDAFSQQLSYPQSQHETHGAYGGQSQAPGLMQQQGQSHIGGFSQGQSDYGSQQYGNEQQRSAFQNYYGSSYGQQGASGVQENAPPQRSTSGFGANESGYGSSQAAPSQSRFGEAQTSGNEAPTLAAATQPQSQSQQGQQMHQQPQGQNSHGGGYPYGQPYYGGSYYGSYMNQVSLPEGDYGLSHLDAIVEPQKQYPGYNYNQQGYGAPFGGKAGGYGQPHHAYGMAPQASYEHSSTTANASALGGSSSQGRDSAFSGGLGEYGRSASTQQSQAQQHHGSYSSFPAEQAETFGRSPSGMNQYGGQQAENLKPFQDPKSGASPSLAQAGRAGSAVNSSGYGGTHSNFAPPQSAQQGFGGYPGHQLHSNHGSQYGGLGGLGSNHQGAAQSHQGAGGYGNYAGGFGSNYGNYGRGGWGGNNYGH